jgi:hypothetical protein
MPITASPLQQQEAPQAAESMADYGLNEERNGPQEQCGQLKRSLRTLRQDSGTRSRVHFFMAMGITATACEHVSQAAKRPANT